MSLGLRKGERNVLMIHGGRSGSRVLGLQLQQNENIRWDHELFLIKKIVGASGEIRENFNPVKYAELSTYNSTRPCYGFQIKPMHFRQLGLVPATFIQSLRERNFTHIIFLTRKNGLRRIISGRVSAKRRKSHHEIDEEPVMTKIKLDPVKVLRKLKQMKHELDPMRNAVHGQKVLDITYEDHIQNDPSIAYRIVCEFLGYDAAPARIQLRKNNPYPMSSLVRNYKTIKSKLEETEFAWMLED